MGDDIIIDAEFLSMIGAANDSIQHARGDSLVPVMNNSADTSKTEKTIQPTDATQTIKKNYTITRRNSGSSLEQFVRSPFYNPNDIIAKTNESLGYDGERKYYPRSVNYTPSRDTPVEESPVKVDTARTDTAKVVEKPAKKIETKETPKTINKKDIRSYDVGSYKTDDFQQPYSTSYVLPPISRRSLEMPMHEHKKVIVKTTRTKPKYNYNKESEEYNLGNYETDIVQPNSSIRYVMPPITRRSLEKNTWADDLVDLYNVALNGITRKYNQYISNNDDEAIEQKSIVNVPEKEYVSTNDSTNVDSVDYNNLGLIDTISVPIIPSSYFGDTIKFKKASRRDFTVPNQYILPGSINLADYKFGVRNRGDKTPLTTQGGIITAFNNFLPFNSNKKYAHGSYYGIDAEGNFKYGDYTDFGPGDYLTRTQSNDVIEILRNEDGTVKLKQSAKNTFAGSPITKVVQGNDTINGSINFLSSSIRGNKGKNTVPVFKKEKQVGYASPYLFDGSRGGSIIATAGDEARLFTGSIANIADFFDEMKARYPDQPIRLYNVDNGTYSKGLRTTTGKITSNQLRMYDNQNLGGGGNFLYIKRNGGRISLETI